MHIVCPACAAMYDVPDRQMKVGRKVRCVSCQNQWVPVSVPLDAAGDVAEAEEPGPVAVHAAPPPVPGMTAMDRLAAHQVAPKRNMVLLAAWAGSAVAVVLLVLAAYGWRADLVSAWPPSARLYAALGLVDSH